LLELRLARPAEATSWANSVLSKMAAAQPEDQTLKFKKVELICNKEKMVLLKLNCNDVLVCRNLHKSTLGKIF
jgi:hypothetical protein